MNTSRKQGVCPDRDFLLRASTPRDISVIFGQIYTPNFGRQETSADSKFLPRFRFLDDSILGRGGWEGGRREEGDGGRRDGGREGRDGKEWGRYGWGVGAWREARIDNGLPGRRDREGEGSEEGKIEGLEVEGGRNKEMIGDNGEEGES